MLNRSLFIFMNVFIGETAFRVRIVFGFVGRTGSRLRGFRGEVGSSVFCRLE